MIVWMRAGVVLIVIVAHLILLRLLSHRQRREHASDTSMQLVLIPERVSPQAPPPSSKPLPSQPGNRTRANPNAPSTSIQGPQPSTPSIDWHASATAAASNAVAKQLQEKSYRNFGAPKRDRVETSAPSIFEEPKHKAGDIENDQRNGVTRVYHSEHCFTQLDYPTLKDPGEELKPKINLPRCMYDVGKGEADGDLFKHLKKEHPLPELKHGTHPEPLPEAVDPTK